MTASTMNTRLKTASTTEQVTGHRLGGIDHQRLLRYRHANAKLDRLGFVLVTQGVEVPWALRYCT